MKQTVSLKMNGCAHTNVRQTGGTAKKTYAKIDLEKTLVIGSKNCAVYHFETIILYYFKLQVLLQWTVPFTICPRADLKDASRSRQSIDQESIGSTQNSTARGYNNTLSHLFFKILLCSNAIPRIFTNI